jgi:hypothetical protein
MTFFQKTTIEGRFECPALRHQQASGTQLSMIGVFSLAI